jgi:hypothetical protein
MQCRLVPVVRRPCYRHRTASLQTVHPHNSEQHKQDSGGSRGLEAYGGIVTPSDEFQFWAATVTEKAVGGRAILKAVSAAFEPLRSSFAALDTLQHSELEEVRICITLLLLLLY